MIMVSGARRSRRLCVPYSAEIWKTMEKQNCGSRKVSVHRKYAYEVQEHTPGRLQLDNLSAEHHRKLHKHGTVLTTKEAYDMYRRMH